MPALICQAPSAAPIQRLPHELLDIIFSQLDSHSDLVHLALSTLIFKQLIIPRHTDYRVICTRHRLPALWAHLAKRADLARNIKEVHLRERYNQSSPDRYPKDYPEQNVFTFATEEQDEDARIQNMCIALGHMSHLRTFTWSANAQVDTLHSPTFNVMHEMAVFNALRYNKPELTTVSLAGKFAHRRPEVVSFKNTPAHPLFLLQNLRFISLLGSAWATPSNKYFIRSMLRHCPDVESLHLPMELGHILSPTTTSTLANCDGKEPSQSPAIHFPKLTQLTLTLQSGATAAIDDCWATFLEKHDTLEKLEWQPVGLSVNVKPDALPNLKELKTNSILIDALSATEQSVVSLRKITCLTIAFAAWEDSAMEVVLERLKLVLDSQALTYLYVADPAVNFGMNRPEAVVKSWIVHLANDYPNLSYLSLPEWDMDVESWISSLVMFPKLEYFRRQALWSACSRVVTQITGPDGHKMLHCVPDKSSEETKQRMHKAIFALVTRLPHLKELDHYQKYHKNGLEQRICILRKMDETGVMHVTYDVQKPLLSRGMSLDAFHPL